MKLTTKNKENSTLSFSFEDGKTTIGFEQNKGDLSNDIVEEFEISNEDFVAIISNWKIVQLNKIKEEGANKTPKVEKKES